MDKTSFQHLILLVCLCSWIVSYAEATKTKCEHCRIEFACLSKHSWRCPAKTTSTRTADNSTPTPDSTNAGNTNHSVNALIVEKETPEHFHCICGKKCKGLKGLKMHHRCCKL